MPSYPSADLVPISALQHYLFCPRQCALIHLEQVWEENLYTAEGRLLSGTFSIAPSRGRGLKLLIQLEVLILQGALPHGGVD